MEFNLNQTVFGWQCHNPDLITVWFDLRGLITQAYKKLNDWDKQMKQTSSNQIKYFDTMSSKAT